MKKILYGFSALAIAAVVAFNVNLNIESEGLAGIILENVEALGAAEGSVTCCPDEGDTCDVGGTRVNNYDEC